MTDTCWSESDDEPESDNEAGPLSGKGRDKEILDCEADALEDRDLLVVAATHVAA
jgi:hypothetical protein